MNTSRTIFLTEGTTTLPFLKPKTAPGLIIAKRKPDGTKQELHEEGDENHALEACAEDLLRGIASKDAKQIAEAMRAAFEILESEPHEEYSDSEEDESQE